MKTLELFLLFWGMLAAELFEGEDSPLVAGVFCGHVRVQGDAELPRRPQRPENGAREGGQRIIGERETEAGIEVRRRVFLKKPAHKDRAGIHCPFHLALSGVERVEQEGRRGQ